MAQRRLAECCIEIFGDMLLKEPLLSWPVSKTPYITDTVKCDSDTSGRGKFYGQVPRGLGQEEREACHLLNFFFVLILTS